MSFRAVLDQDPDAILICSENQRIGYANPAAAILLAEATSIVEPSGIAIDEVFGQLFDNRAGFRPNASNTLKRNSGFTARDRAHRKLQIYSFTLNTGTERTMAAFRLRDITVDEAHKRSRAGATERLNLDYSDSYSPPCKPLIGPWSC